MPEEIQENKRYFSADEWLPVYLEMIKEGREVKINPTGYSMYPFLASKRDEAVLAVLPETLKRGDICIYRREGGKHVIHRIHHIDKNGGIYMVGDAQSEIEGPLERSQMLAYVKAIVRKGKYTPCDDKWYCFKWKCWMLLRPVRPFIIKAFNAFRRLIITPRKDSL